MRCLKVNHMSKQIDEERFLRYLKKNKLTNTVNTLILTRDNLSNRTLLIEDKLTQYERIEDEIKNKYLPGKSAQDQVSILSPLFKKLHYVQLEIIKDISILIETWLLYSYALRTDYKKVKGIVNTKRHAIHTPEKEI